jgi:hypothetical protein
LIPKNGVRTLYLQNLIFKIMEQAELEFMFFMKGTSGSFMTNLFKTIMSADIQNQTKLSLGFPNEVEVVRRYKNEDGYWQQLQTRFE